MHQQVNNIRTADQGQSGCEEAGHRSSCHAMLLHVTVHKSKLFV